MENLAKLEQIATELIRDYGILTPPVPVETMLRNPGENMWKQVDVNQLSGSFLSLRDRFSPRMSMARLLVRHVAYSPWGKERNLHLILVSDEELIRAFARMLVMPSDMMASLSNSYRNPASISMKFEVPEDDARQRLMELAQI